MAPVVPSPKQEVYQDLLMKSVAFLRNRETLPWWRRIPSRYHEAELVHNLYTSILEPGFVRHDIHFLNCQAKNYFDSGQHSPNYAGHVKRIRKLFSLVPEEMRAMLEWPGPRPDLEELYDCIEAGDAAALRSLLDARADPNAHDVNSFSPLIRAADEGRADLVAMLLEAGASPDHESDSGDTPLICAVTANSPECVRLLLDAGANPRTPSRFGASALDYAEGKPEILALLERAK